MTVEEGVVEQHVPVGFRPAVEQHVDGTVPFTVEYRTKKDKRTEHHTAQQQFGIAVLAEPCKDVLAHGHGPDEIQADQSAAHPEGNARRHTLQHPCSVEPEVEERVAAHKHIGETSGRDA